MFSKAPPFKFFEDWTNSHMNKNSKLKSCSNESLKWNKYFHIHEFQSSNPEFTQCYTDPFHPLGVLHSHLRINAKYTHQIFSQLQRYLSVKVRRRSRGRRRSSWEAERGRTNTFPELKKDAMGVKSPGGRNHYQRQLLFSPEYPPGFVWMRTGGTGKRRHGIVSGHRFGWNVSKTVASELSY